jgi:hypothetical protein
MIEASCNAQFLEVPMRKSLEQVFSIGVLLALLLAACGAPAGSPAPTVAATAKPVRAPTPLPKVHGNLQLIEFFAIT